MQGVAVGIVYIEGIAVGVSYIEDGGVVYLLPGGAAVGAVFQRF